MCVLPVASHGAPPGGDKNSNSRFLRFFVRSVPLSRSLRLTPMHDTGCDGTGHQIAAPIVYAVCTRHSAVQY